MSPAMWSEDVPAVCSARLESQILRTLLDCNCENLEMKASGIDVSSEAICRTPVQERRREYLGAIGHSRGGTKFANQCPTWYFIIQISSVFDPMFQKWRPCLNTSHIFRVNPKIQAALTMILPSLAAKEAPSHWPVLLSNDVPTRTFASPRRMFLHVIGWSELHFIRYRQGEMAHVDICN